MQRTLREDLLTKGVRGRFYLDTSRQNGVGGIGVNKEVRAYEVLDINFECSRPEISTNIYDGDIKPELNSIYPKFYLAEHLEDIRITPARAKKCLKGLDDKIGGKWIGIFPKYRKQADGPTETRPHNAYYRQQLLFVLDTIKEFIDMNYKYFGINKKPKMPEVIFFRGDYALWDKWEILLNGDKDPLVNPCHETAHLLHYAVSPQMWTDKMKIEFRDEKLVRELVAETATIRHIINLGLLQKVKDITRDLENTFSEFVINRYDLLEESLPVLIRARSMTEVFAKTRITKEFLDETFKAREHPSLDKLIAHYQV